MVAAASRNWKTAPTCETQVIHSSVAQGWPPAAEQTLMVGSGETTGVQSQKARASALARSQRKSGACYAWERALGNQFWWAVSSRTAPGIARAVVLGDTYPLEDAHHLRNSCLRYQSRYFDDNRNLVEEIPSADPDIPLTRLAEAQSRIVETEHREIRN